MPHQCVRCNTLFEDGSKELLTGCTTCGGKFFFYINKNKVNEAKNITSNLSKEQKKQIEEDIFEIVGDKINQDQPVFLDIESIRILKPGHFEIDLVHLFRDQPLIYKLEDGKYVIDLVSSFKAREKNI